MVHQDSPPTSSILHQFLNPDSISSQNQIENQHFDAFGADLRTLPSIQSLGERMSTSIDLVHVPPTAHEPNINHARQLSNLLQTSNESNIHQAQKLSLSLGSWMLVPPAQYRQRSLPSNLISSTYPCNDYSIPDSSFASSSASQYQASSNFCAAESFMISIGDSKYLKPAQSLLEEAVSVAGNSVHMNNENYIRRLSPTDKKGSLGFCSELKAELCNNGLSLENQEFGAKLSKLVSLLEEVERRFQEYYHRMEEVVSSFEVIAGVGSGNSYTALALQAMSRHFCSLKDAISYQICVTRRKYRPRMHTGGLSQLSLIDRDMTRVSLQQLGMIQGTRQTWRPIRGLPETSVTILRSWLFEHFLHPYPNDAEKLVLASQTGLSKNQVSNWFINARVRLWKPMIEEMYKEEFADDSIDPLSESNSNSISSRRFTDDAEESSV